MYDLLMSVLAVSETQVSRETSSSSVQYPDLLRVNSRVYIADALPRVMYTP